MNRPASSTAEPAALAERCAPAPAAGSRVAGLLRGGAVLLLSGAVRLYQLAVSPLIYALCGRVCRFEPSCSQYFLDAVRKHGPWRGTLKGLWRICRCHPWSPGGYDPA
jgi:putative membrane protein insertion efficiency factor